MPQLLNAAIKSGLEGFVNPNNSAEKKDSYIQLAAILITFIISLVII